MLVVYVLNFCKDLFSTILMNGIKNRKIILPTVNYKNKKMKRQ